MNSNRNQILPLLVFILPLLLFIKTMAPTYLPPDSAEFSLCIYFLGICHPPGFPLYILASKLLVTLIPFGTLIAKTNFLSALFGAWTIFFLYLILINLKINRILAFILSLYLATTAVFWSLSVVTDVFTFGTLLLTVTIYAVFCKKPLLAFLILGFMTSNFYVSGFLLPILLWYFYKLGYSYSSLLKSCLWFAVGLSPQVFMFIRMMANPPINWGHVKNFSEFIDFVRRKEFGSFFIISNPSSTFSFSNLIGHFYIYFKSLLSNFAFILPIFTFLTLIIGKIFKYRKISLLLICYLILLVISLFTLSSTNPYDPHSPFNFSKFYLTSYVLFIPLLAISLQFILSKLPSEFNFSKIYFAFIILVAVTLMVNYHRVDLSQNKYSYNLLSDALGQLPDNSIAIIINHQIYFGGRYEQELNKRFNSLKLVYYPNDINQDASNYHPELYQNSADLNLKKQITKGKQLTPVQEYILDLIARNPKQNIFILQGSYEDLVFGYLKPYIKPYGLWWQFNTDLSWKDNNQHIIDLFKNLKNQPSDKSKVQELQYLEPFVYAYGYFYSGVELAENGAYDQSLDFLGKSRSLSDNPNLIDQTIGMVSLIKNLEVQKATLIQNSDKDRLNQLAALYFNLGNYTDAIDTFSSVDNIAPNDANTYNNIASSYASLGDKKEAIIYYQKALNINPKLDSSIDGLSRILSN